MKKLLFGLFLGIFVFSFVSSALAQEAVIRTVPYNDCPWIADGVTQYRMDVFADNTGLNGDVTDAIQWRNKVPAGLDGYIDVVRAEIPSIENNGREDFFAGSSMFFEIVRPDWSGQARVVDLGQGKANRQGYVGSYWFIVRDIQRPVRTSFNLDATGFADPNGVLQPYRIENVPFVVLPNNFPFMSAKCRR